MCRSRGPRWLLRELSLRIALCAVLALAVQLGTSSALGFEEVWRTRYSPSPGGEEEGLFATTDAAGNVYVVGTAEELEGSYRGTYTTVIKYAVTGEVLWAEDLHNFGDAHPVALSVDSSGAAYVLTNTDYEDDGGDDMAYTVKFDSDGRFLWGDTFPGDEEDSADDDDWKGAPHGLVLASDGGAYTLCTWTKETAESSMVIIRYGPDGKVSWIAERPGESGSAIALAPGGGVIAAGGTPSGLFTVVYGGDGTERSFATAHIGASMSVQKIALGVDGTLHLAGFAEGTGVIVKLDSRGELLWWNPVAAGEIVDVAGVVLFENGDVLVAGSAGPSDGLIGFVTKQDPSGRLLWRTSFAGADPTVVKGLLVAPDGNLRLTGSIGSMGTRDYWTAAFDSSGAMLWEKRHDGGGEDTANALAIDRAGNVHVTGASFRRNSRDMVTVSYDSSGSELRLSRFEYPQEAYIHDTASDSEGNAILAGACGRNGTVLKYDRDGALHWEYYFQRTSDADDGLTYSLAVDEENRILVADLQLLAKLDVAGETLWVKEEEIDWYEHVKVDGKGNIYLTFYHYINDSWPYITEHILAKLDGGGRELWRRTLQDSFIRQLGLDLEGRPILAVEGTTSDSVIKYDQDGDILWSAPAPMGFRVREMLVDDFLNIYLRGNVSAENTIGLVKLNPLGQVIWRVIESQSSIYDVVLDSKGNAYTIDERAVLRKLSPDGRELWRSNDLSAREVLFIDASDTLFTTRLDYSRQERPLYVVSEIDSLGHAVARFILDSAECCIGSGPIAFTSDGELIVAATWDHEYLSFKFRPSGKKLFLRGDVNRDGALLMDDAIVGLEWLFRGGPEPACRDAADSNDDGRNDITDPVNILNHLFTGGPAPPPPFPGEGPDPTADGLGCSP